MNPTFPLPDLVYLPKLEKFELISTPKESNDHPDPASFNLEPVTKPSVSRAFQHLSEISTTNLNDWSVFCQTTQDRINYSPPFPALEKFSINVTKGKQALANIPVLAHISSLKESTLFNVGMLAEDYYGSDLHLSDHLRPFRKTLEVLTLNCVSVFDYHPVNFDYPLNTALESIANENMLETLNLLMEIQIPCVRAPFTADTSRLATLSGILCRPGAFSHLKKATLHAEVFVHEDIFKGDDETHNMLQSVTQPAISRLQCSETIAFTFNTTYETDICCSVCEFDPNDRYYIGRCLTSSTTMLTP